eukprot:347446-Chlamydomonas_euryale.AAC.2
MTRTPVRLRLASLLVVTIVTTCSSFLSPVTCVDWAEHAAHPWAVSQGTALPWEGLANDLDKLVNVMAAAPSQDVQMPHRWISMLTMTGCVKRSLHAIACPAEH